MKKCRHTRPKELGQTVHRGFLALIYWCPECGSVRYEHTSGPYKKSRWKSPSQQATAIDLERGEK